MNWSAIGAAGELLGAVAVTLALYVLPYGRLVGYPLVLLSTYAHEIGAALGCGGHLSALRRTRSGKFLAEGGVTFSELKQSTREEIRQRVITLSEVSKLRGA